MVHGVRKNIVVLGSCIFVKYSFKNLVTVAYAGIIIRMMADYCLEGG